LRRFGTAFTAVMAGTAAMAGTAHAQAVSITPAKACYLTGERINLSGSGFTAGGSIDVTLDGTSLGALTADAAGNIAAEIGLGTMRGIKTHTLTATDTGNPALTSTASFVGTTLRVTVKPANAKAGRKLRVRGQGLLAADGSLAGKNVFMHVRGPRGYRSDGRVARLKAPCGSFDARKRIVEPDASNGVYRVQFDAARKFSKKTRPRFEGRMTVFTRATSSGARASLFGGAELARRWTSLAS
jgi:hypothetical protein